MEMLDKFHDDVSKVWIAISNGKTIQFSDYQKNSFNINAIFHVGYCYYYFFDLTSSAFLYVSPEIKDILGYDSEQITVKEFLSYIHSEDAPYFLRFEEKVREFYAQLQIHQVLKYKVSYDYRLKNKSGKYIRLLQQVVCVNHRNEGRILQTLGVHTDITHIKQTGKPNLSFIGLQGEPSFYDIDTISKTENEIFTNRELDVIRSIANGKSTTAIAKELFISESTVAVHRKNILKKWNGKTMNQLIYHAVRNGWL